MGLAFVDNNTVRNTDLERQLDQRDVIRGPEGRWRWIGSMSEPTHHHSTAEHQWDNAYLHRPSYDPAVASQYRVVAQNTVGYLDGSDPLDPLLRSQR